jgi:hypothetical protein
MASQTDPQARDREQKPTTKGIAMRWLAMAIVASSFCLAASPSVGATVLDRGSFSRFDEGDTK